MDWIREHKTLAGILGVFGVGALALAFLAWTSYSGYAEALEEYDTSSKKLARLEGAALYPSKENLEKKTQIVREFQAEVGKLQGALLNLQPQVKDVTDTEFQAKLKQLISEVRVKAGVVAKADALEKDAADSGKLPKNFAFGFDIYTATLPSPEAVKELNDYLDSVNEVVNLCLDGGVKKIVSLERSDLAVEGKGGAAAATPSSSFVIQTNNDKSKSKNAQDAAPPAAKVVERRTLKIQISGDQPAIQAVLNGLASASVVPHFSVVRVLRLENSKMTGPIKGQNVAKVDDEPKPSTAASGPQVDENGVPIPAPAVEVIAAPVAAPVDAAVVMGDEDLHVYLEIDIIKFLNTAAE